MSEDCIQVVMTDPFIERFKDYLASRRLHLFHIPLDSDDDLPTYGIGINQDLWEEVNGR